jgi:hypothetical protein
MKYSEKELEKYIRKAPLREIIEEIKSNGIKVKYDKYPKIHTLKVLRKIIIDYQDLVPSEQPDLNEMTEAVDDGYNVVEVVKPKPKVRKPDWKLIKSIDTSDPHTKEGRAQIVRAIYLELLFREPDHVGLNSFSEHIENGMSIANLRDAIKRSVEYKKKHKI